MPTFEGQFLSIVFTGRHNPQILNHDFLVKNEILPKDEAPFIELFDKQDSNPFTEFISTPVLSSLKYGPISIVIEESRYQIMDGRFNGKPETTIIDISRRYFGKLLRHTPLKLGGFNFNGIIEFADIQDEQPFYDRLGLRSERLAEITGATEMQIGVVLSYSWAGGMIEVALRRDKAYSPKGQLNFNYEFEYKDIDSFLGNLDDFEKVYQKFSKLLQSLGVRNMS